MPRARPRTRLQLIAEALEHTHHAQAVLATIDLRSTRGDLSASCSGPRRWTTPAPSRWSGFAIAYERRALGIGSQWPFESWAVPPEHTIRSACSTARAPPPCPHHRRRQLPHETSPRTDRHSDEGKPMTDHEHEYRHSPASVLGPFPDHPGRIIPASTGGSATARFTCRPTGTTPPLLPPACDARAAGSPVDIWWSVRRVMAPSGTAGGGTGLWRQARAVGYGE